MEQPLTGLVVDWGGVLTSAMPESMSRWAQAEGIDLAAFRAVMAEWLGPAAAAAAELNPIHALERGELSVPDFDEALARRLGVRMGRPLAAAGLVSRMMSHLEHADDMAALVRRARRSGIRTALLSNSWGNEYPDDLFEGMFDVVVISGEVGMRKPEPEIFEHTLELLGLAAGDCVFVDDMETNIAAAVRLGMVGVRHVDYATTAAELAVLFERPLA